MNEPKRVVFFQNGAVMVFDKDGHQIPELQEPWLLLFAQFLKVYGFNPLNVEFTLPSGMEASLFETTAGHYNWRIT